MPRALTINTGNFPIIAARSEDFLKCNHCGFKFVVKPNGLIDMALFLKHKQTHKSMPVIEVHFNHEKKKI